MESEDQRAPRKVQKMNINIMDFDEVIQFLLDPHLTECIGSQKSIASTGMSSRVRSIARSAGCEQSIISNLFCENQA